MNKYLVNFESENFENSENKECGNRKFVNALLNVVQSYISDNYPTEGSTQPKNEIHTALDKFIKYLRFSAPFIEVGRIFSGYRFKAIREDIGSSTQQETPPKSLRLSDKPWIPDLAMPTDFMEVFEAAKKIEMQLFEQKKTSAFPACVYIAQQAAARNEFDSPTLIEQVDFLLKILKNKKNPPCQEHIKVIQDQVNEWVAILYCRTSQLIYNASSHDNLIETIQKIFNKNRKTLDIYLISVKKEVFYQVDLLHMQKFFDKYYTLKHVDEKYNYVKAVYDNLYKEKKLGQNTKTLLDGLLGHIVEMEYKHLNNKKHKLMEEADSTVGKVFDCLESEITSEYFFKPNFQLVRKALDLKLYRERAEWENWERVSHCHTWGDPKPYRTYQPLMREVSCVKGDNPKGDPFVVLQQHLGKNPPAELLEILRLKKVSKGEEEDPELALSMNALSLEKGNQLKEKFKPN